MSARGSSVPCSIEGHDVVATTRDPDRLADFGWHDQVTGVALDANDEASAKEAFADAGPIDVVLYLVHGIGQPDFRDADNRAAGIVANAAKDAGVRRIVYLGGFVPDVDELSEHLTSRAEVAHCLSVDGGPDVVWLGAAMIIGSGSTSFEMLRYVGDRLCSLLHRRRYSASSAVGAPVRPDASALPTSRPQPTAPGAMPATRKIVCIETTFDSGPTIANDTGMKASETKKSRLDTRPNISVGTRRCSSVPQMTIPAPSVRPMMNVAYGHQRERRGHAEDHQRYGADTPHRHHHRQVATRQPPLLHHQRTERAARHRRTPG